MNGQSEAWPVLFSDAAEMTATLNAGATDFDESLHAAVAKAREKAAALEVASR